MIYLLSAVPEQLKDFWYVYDLALLAVIGMCVLVLVFLRKRSHLKEAEKSIKTVKNILRKTKLASVHRKKLLLFSAKNVLNSAEYHYSICISEEDQYTLIATVNKIKKTVERLDEIAKNDLQKEQEEFAQIIDEIISYL